MTFLRFQFMLLLLAALAACNVKPPASVSAPPSPPTTETKEPPRPIDIGDVEAALRIIPAVAAESAGPGVHVEEMKDTQGHVLMASANVSPPRPAQFWVTFRLVGVRLIERVPVAVRVRILRDKQPIAEFATFFDPGWYNNPHEQRFDVLTGLDSAPSTLLVHAEADLIMLPPGTETATVDPATVTGEPDMTGVVIGSPMRINFGAGAAAP
ncbi:MAG TPA: hypothetical protein P5318_13020 [Candidatus Hydrogenedentes bacterium]|nr:hypothetical protein [Candidatus Hydrogenedentota bacterium]HPC17139.1 hypothetical protein [Candidatus Hydrogenedentota bacterium]HRT21040.1 hypothetical protein [Candidatus Hydrogenedentota bacterium]HRT65869.1 hypothetical protein [Candidatus Hydrogenedentota bacterium]